MFAAGIISLLEEPMPELKVFALKKLNMIVDEFWPEISEAIEKMYVYTIKLTILLLIVILCLIFLLFFCFFLFLLILLYLLQ